MMDARLDGLAVALGQTLIIGLSVNELRLNLTSFNDTCLTTVCPNKKKNRFISEISSLPGKF